jgi:hypothetical protein
MIRFFLEDANCYYQRLSLPKFEELDDNFLPVAFELPAETLACK